MPNAVGLFGMLVIYVEVRSMVHLFSCRMVHFMVLDYK